MSKLLNVLKLTPWTRAKPSHPRTPRIVPPTRPERRPATRTFVQIPLFVYGYPPEGEPFYEEVTTVAIHADGGVISMETVVRPGQLMLVTNKGNEQAQQCVVVSVVARLGNKLDVEIKFPVPAPKFWRNVEIGKNPTLSALPLSG